MEINLKFTETKYPYLAVWVGQDTTLNQKEIRSIKREDIVLISKIEKIGVTYTYIQFLLGGKEAYTSCHESEYFPLPNGFIAEIIQ